MHWISAPEPPVPQVCVPAIDDLLANSRFPSSKAPHDRVATKTDCE